MISANTLISNEKKDVEGNIKQLSDEIAYKEQAIYLLEEMISDSKQDIKYLENEKAKRQPEIDQLNSLFASKKESLKTQMATAEQALIADTEGTNSIEINQQLNNLNASYKAIKKDFKEQMKPFNVLDLAINGIPEKIAEQQASVEKNRNEIKLIQKEMHQLLLIKVKKTSEKLERPISLSESDSEKEVVSNGESIREVEQAQAPKSAEAFSLSHQPNIQALAIQSNSNCILPANHSSSSNVSSSSSSSNLSSISPIGSNSSSSSLSSSSNHIGGPKHIIKISAEFLTRMTKLDAEFQAFSVTKTCQQEHYPRALTNVFRVSYEELKKLNAEAAEFVIQQEFRKLFKSLTSTNVKRILANKAGQKRKPRQTGSLSNQTNEQNDEMPVISSDENISSTVSSTAMLTKVFSADTVEGQKNTLALKSMPEPEGSPKRQKQTSTQSEPNNVEEDATDDDNIPSQPALKR